jgi:hypothetical protein
LFYHLTRVSGNSKTGPIPVSITSKDSCPNSCPLKKSGCYAENSYLAMHWKRVTSGRSGSNINNFVSEISKLPRHSLWRHNQAGDLPGRNNSIDSKALYAIVQANKKIRGHGFTFTHKPVLGNSKSSIKNKKIIKEANKNGFTINLSANNLEHADKLVNVDCAPVVAIVPSTVPRHGKTPNGNSYSVCPAQERNDITCSNCGLCAIPDRKAIIAFRVHGIAKNKALKVYQNYENK